MKYIKIFEDFQDQELKMPTSGEQVPMEHFVSKGYMSERDQKSFIDSIFDSIGEFSAYQWRRTKPAALKAANDFLKENGFKFRFSDVIDTLYHGSKRSIDPEQNGAHHGVGGMLEFTIE
jgi:hypothetical protein